MSLKEPLTYFAIFFEAFDAESFASALKTYDANGVIVIWNYAGRIRIVHQPPDLDLPSEYRFFTPKTWTELKWVKWPRQLAMLMWIVTRVLMKRKTKRFFLGGGDVVLWFAQFFKSAGRIEQIVTTCEDWSMPKRAHDVGDWVNRQKFLLNDWLMAKLKFRVILFTKEIYEKRNAYWSGLTKPGSILFEEKWASFLEPKAELPPARPGKSILLLGTVRRNFGLEILFHMMPELDREHGIRLKVIGIESPLYQEYKARCDESGASASIDWLGFVDYADLKETIVDCFCGYDMQENEENNSKWIVPGRIVNYLQYMIVPVISPHSGSIVDFIAGRNLGVICQPQPVEIKKAILEAFENYSLYAKNSQKFFAENPYKRTVPEFLGL